MSNNNKNLRQNRLRKILAGIDLHFANVSTLTLGNKPVATADLKKAINADIAASDASVKAKADLHTTVTAEKASHAQLDPQLRLFKFFVTAQFGDDGNASTVLADFGFTSRKSPKATSTTKAAAAGKSKATRAQRHTMGKKQKAKVHGNPPAPAPAEATPAAATPAATTPAPKTPNA
jgi:hypothetical protein